MELDFQSPARMKPACSTLALKHFRFAAEKAAKGFTLLEVLVSLTIVAMTVTVFFQLISSGMKLEHRSGQRVDAAVRAQQMFERLQIRDVREDDFEWQGEDNGCAWDLAIRPEDIQSMQMDDDTPAMKKETELYTYIFGYTCRDDREIVLERMVVVGPNFFSDQFKKDHMDL